jgi:hypothetical protein
VKTADILPILQRWASAINAADKSLAALRHATGLNPEAPLPKAVYALQDIADEWAAERVGTSPDWFSWYRLENKMGQRGHEAGWDDALRPVRNLRSFAALLAEELRRAAAAGVGEG